MRVQATLPVAGCTPDTEVVFDTGGPVFANGIRVGEMVGIVEVRKDEVVVDLEVEEPYAEFVKESFDNTFCGIAETSDGERKFYEREHRHE